MLGPVIILDGPRSSQHSDSDFPRYGTGQSICSLRKVPIEILSGWRHITWVLVVLLISAKLQMEPLVPHDIYY